MMELRLYLLLLVWVLLLMMLVLLLVLPLLVLLLLLHRIYSLQSRVDVWRRRRKSRLRRVDVE